jgi:hypothetical protein
MNLVESIEKDFIPIPNKTYILNEKKIEEILININALCDEKLKIIVENILKNVIHINFKTFLKYLNISIQKFEQKVKNQFVLYIPTDSSKSNYWVSQMVYHLLKKKPVDVINQKTFAFIQSDIEDILLCDDGSYTGEQMSYYINKIENTHKNLKRIHLVIPFLAEDARIWMMSLTKCIIIFYASHKIPYFNTSEIESKSLIYFDHKIPDDISFYSKLLNQGKLFSDFEKNEEIRNVLKNCGEKYKSTSLLSVLDEKNK